MKYEPKLIRSVLLILLFLPMVGQATTYYVSSSGSDNNTGKSLSSAIKTINQLNKIQLVAGDTVKFEGGSSFLGSMMLTASEQGSASQPIVIMSFGTGRAMINAGDSVGLYSYNTSGIEVRGINFSGSVTSRNGGIYFYTDKTDITLSHIVVEDVEVSGFYDYGIQIGCSSPSKGFSDVLINRAVSHDNKNGGILSANDGNFSAFNHHSITVTNCTTYNNKGIPGYGNQSGNGILLSSVAGALVDHCLAYNNGENCDFDGGGPVGIWFSQVNNGIIQNCESHHNKTKTIDGGGFDLDGGCQNSIIQYCYTHDNMGAGLLLAEYGTGILFTGNIIRYNISENDGQIDRYGSILVWGADQNAQVTNSKVYNNTIYSGHLAVALFDANFSNVTICNNIFYCLPGTKYIEGSADSSKIHFIQNDYYSTGSNTVFNWNGAYYNSVAAWKSAAVTQERVGSKNYGLSVDPQFSAPGSGRNGYTLPSNSPVIDAGFNMTGIGSNDFYGGLSKVGASQDIGANEYQAANAAVKDTIAPSVPLNLKVVTVTTSAARVAWDNATDNIGVTGYDVFINATKKYNSVTDSITISNLKADSSFILAVRAFDSTGNVSALSVPLTVKAASAKDTTAPSIPVNLKVVAVTTSTARIAWDNATDNIGVIGYDVFVNGTKKYSSITDSITISNLKADSSFILAVRAFDSTGNVSALSVPLTVKAASAKDTIAPSIPVNLKVVAVTTSSARITWDNSADNIGVTGYDVFINGTKKYITVTDSITIAGLKADSSFSVAVRSFDSTGNISALSVPITVKSAPAKDTVAPSVPVNLKVVVLTVSTARVAWDNAVDNVGVTGYDVFINGTKKYTTVTDSVTIASLKADSSFSVAVRSFDSSGNVSALSAPLSIKVVSGKDTIAPSVPLNLKVVSVIKASARVAWDNATDNIGVTGYDVFINGIKKYSTVTDSITLSNLKADSSFTLSVRAFDSSANFSALSVPLTIKAASNKDTTAPTVPGNVIVTSQGANYIGLSWTASTDSIGVVAYDVYVGGVKKYTTTTNSVTADSLAANTTYSFTVKARDLAGNVSAASTPLAATTTSVAAANGLNYKYYQGAWNSLPDFTTLTPVKTGITSNVDISIRPTGYDDFFGFLWEGYINIPAAGTYTFETVSDDGSKFYFNSAYVPSATAAINNDGLHGATTVTATVNVTAAGYYPIAAAYFEKDGGQSMQVYWTGPNITRQLIPNSAFVYQLPADNIAPTAPTNLAASLTNSTFISLSWTASTDNVGVTGYDVYINGVKKYTTTNTTITADSLTAATAYVFTVKARDFAGNSSAFSPALTTSTSSTPSGLTYKYYEGNWDVLPNFSALTPLKTGFTPNVDIITVRNVSDYYGFVWEGNITLPATGTYTFETVSDDGSKFYFNQKYSATATALVNNDGVHGPISATGSVTTTAGVYPIAISFFEKNSGESMQLYWTGPGIPRQLIPNAAFSGSYVVPADTIAPTVPANVTAILANSTFINLSWTASSDNVGVIVYDVYIGGVKKYTTTTNSVTADSLAANTTYSFTVKARDLAGNVSAASTPLAATTTSVAAANGLNYKYYQGTWNSLPDFTTLTPVKTGITSNVDISIRPTGYDDFFGFLWEGYINIPAAGTYTFETVSDDGSKFYFNSAYVPSATATINNDGLHGATTVTATVNVAAAGYYPIAAAYFEKDGGQSMQVYWTGPNITRQLIPNSAFVYQLPADNIAPTAPTNLAASLTNSTFISLSWTASTDNVGVTGYDVYVNGVKKYTTTNTTITADSLIASTSYTFTVKARDFAGNTSSFSTALTTSTSSTPSGLTYKYYEGNWDVLPNFSALTPLKTGFTPNVDIITVRNVSDYYGFVWEGNITLPATGTYTFETVSDDGSKFYFNQKYSATATALVNNDGLHGATSATGAVTTPAGIYPIAITFFEKNGGESMQVYWTGPGIPRQLIPNAAFSGGSLQADTIPPSAPANLKVVSASQNIINLHWDVSTDNNAVAGYDIYRNGVKKYSSATNDLVADSLSPATSYTFTIKARDLTGNSSAFSTPVTGATTAASSSGLNYRYYEGTWDQLPNFSALNPVKTGSSPNIDLGVRPSGKDYYYGLVWEGNITIPTAGTYTFETVSDDGSKLYFNQTYSPTATALLNNDGIHAPVSATGTVNISTAGTYPIAISFFQKEGGQQMQVYWTGPGISRQLIPDAAFSSTATATSSIGNQHNIGVTTIDLPNAIPASAKIYPNPFYNKLTIAINNQASTNTFGAELYDFSGKLLHTEQFGQLPAGNSFVTLNWGNRQLIPGIYWIRIIVNGIPGKSIKLVKGSK